MTGKEKRVLLGYSALKSKKTEEPSSEADSLGLIKANSFQLDKLSFNLDTLVDYCEHVSFGSLFKFFKPFITHI